MNGFTNRRDAGRRLAAELMSYAPDDPIVLAIPKGGVPVGYEVARALRAPLDIWIVRKVGVPWHQEFGMGAVAEGGYIELNRAILDAIGISENDLSLLIDERRREVEQRVLDLRGKHPPPRLHRRSVILVDDGIATGGTVRAAIASIRAQGPRSIALAVPVAALDTLRSLPDQADDIICLWIPAQLDAVGRWYEDFRPVSDSEVVDLLERSRSARGERLHDIA